MGDTKPREADTARDTGHGRQMMGDTEPREADTACDTRRTHFKIDLSTPTANCLGKKMLHSGRWGIEFILNFVGCVGVSGLDRTRLLWDHL